MAQSVLGKINYLTEEQYNKAKAEDRINPNEIYMTPDDVDLSNRDTSPIGIINSYAGLTEPRHWLFCDGRELSRIEYKRLFDVIGTTYGEGDKVTTFNLPNLKGRIPVGVDYSQNEFNTVGKSGGSKYLQQHSHKQSLGDGGSRNGVATYNWHLATNGRWYEGSDLAGPVADNCKTGNSGNLQPYLVLNYIIKVD